MPFSELQEGGSPSEVATAQAEVTKLLATVEEEQAKRFALPKAAQAQCLQVHNPPPPTPCCCWSKHATLCARQACISGSGCHRHAGSGE